MKDLEVMRLQSRAIELATKMDYAATLIKDVRYQLDKDLTPEEIKELKNYVSDISDFLIHS